MDEYEKFYGKIWKTGDSYIITIPSNIIKGGGYLIDDNVIVMMKRKETFASNEKRLK